MLADTQTSHRRAYNLFLVIEGASAVFGALYGTVVAVYRVETAGLNPLQLVLVGTALELSAFIFSIPTGVLADTYSRRLAIIVGMILMGSGFALEGVVPRFGVILLAQVIWGAGAMFISGAREAWITDEIGTDNATHVFVRASQVGTVGALVGIAGSVALASIRLNLPILAGGLLTVALGVALIFVMPETGFHQASPAKECASWRSMSATLRQSGRVVRAAPVLLTVLAAAIVYGASSEGFDRLWTAHFLANFSFPPLAHFAPVVWFGLINAAAMLLGIGVTELVRRFDTRNHRASVRAFFGINAGLILGIVVFGLSRDFYLAVGAYIAVSLLRQARNPIYMAWLAQRADSSVRATVLSMSDQADALGQMAVGPVIGLVGTLNSLRTALVAAAAFLTPSLLLFARAAGQRDALAAPAEPLVAAVEPTAPAG